MLTASAIVQVYDALTNVETKAKVERMVAGKLEQFQKISGKSLDFACRQKVTRRCEPRICKNRVAAAKPTPMSECKISTRRCERNKPK